MDFEEIIYKRRTIRRFKQVPISIDKLKKLIDFARVAPMATNIQSLEFIIVENADIREKLFSLVNFASLLPPDQRTPEKGREPTAYIIVLVNTKIKRVLVDFNVGAAVENILLGAVNLGIASCWMANINAKKIRELLEIPEYYDIKHVISLGYPDEESVMEPYEDSFKYWKDDDGRMHVPKRALEDTIFKIF
ncbi:MAG: nitroreductase family protein [Candidatus Hodarchaeota archaeon]